MSGQNGVHSELGEKEPASTKEVKPYVSTIANPGPAGIFSFAATTFLLSMFKVNTSGIRTSNVVVGMAIFAGGLLQFIAGMWEFPRGNVFGATTFSAYGTFWMSYAAIFIPGSGILAAYGNNTQELSNALGLYLAVWVMFTVMLIPYVINKNLAFSLLLTALAIAFILLAAAEFTNNASLTKGGGIAGIITALIAYYIAISELLAAGGKPIMRLPQGVW